MRLILLDSRFRGNDRIKIFPDFLEFWVAYLNISENNTFLFALKNRAFP
jgi:hypothetical protein